MHRLSLRLELVLAGLIGIYCTYNLISALVMVWNFTTDDAYITWLYAQHVMAGKGLVWHETMPVVEGYSNFLWLLLTILILTLKLPLLFTIKIISCTALFLTLYCQYHVSRFFVSPLLAMLPVLLFSHFYGVSWWTVSGLETMTYCALVLVLVWQCFQLFYCPLPLHPVHQPSFKPVEEVILATKRWCCINILLLLLALIRFEGLIWFFLVAIFIGCNINKQKIAWKEVLNAWGVRSVICFLLPYGLYFFWRLDYFGHLIPNSYRCKQINLFHPFAVDLDYLQLIFPFLIVSIKYRYWVKDCRSIWLWLPSLAYGFMLAGADPVISYGLRLFLAPLALFTILPMIAIYQLLSRITYVEPKTLTGFCLIGLTVLWVPGNNATLLQHSVMVYQSKTQKRLLLADFLNKNAKWGATVLLDDCGIIPYKGRSDLRFIDALCLNNPETTQAIFQHDLPLYANYIAHQVRPDWVITDYYSTMVTGQSLMDLLRQQGFFHQYNLILTLKIGEHPEVGNLEYRLYQRR